ncbi:MAG: hypothetical protein AAGA73_12280 [Pseudomonadota bacterium]
MNETSSLKDPAEPILLVTTKGDATLTAIDPHSGDIMSKAAAGDPNTAKPHELTLTRDGRLAVISLYGNADYGNNQPANQLSIVDLESMAEVRRLDLGLYRGPHGLITDNDGKIWVTVECNQSALVLNPESWNIEQTVWLQVGPHFLARSHHGERIYFSHKEIPFLSVVDARKRHVMGQIMLPRGAQAIQVSPDDRWLYAGDFCQPLLHRIDTESMTLEKTIGLTGVPGWPYPTPDGQFVIVTTYDEHNDVGYVEIADAASLTVLGRVKLNAEPFHAIAAGDGQHIYVALADGSIPKIDLERQAVVDHRLHVGAVMPEALLLASTDIAHGGRHLGDAATMRAGNEG